MFQLGEIVRLNRGWTPMCVIGFNSKQELIAKYCRYIDSIFDDCYKHPYSYASKTRPVSGFVRWDGQPLNFKVTQPMPNMYKTLIKIHPSNSGEYVTTLDSGNIVIRTSDNEFHEYHPSHLEIDIPWTFSVKAVSKNYTCHYTLNPHIEHVNVNDVLLSSNGNMYIVTKTDTKQRNPKKEFKGYLIPKVSI